MLVRDFLQLFFFFLCQLYFDCSYSCHFPPFLVTTFSTPQYISYLRLRVLVQQAIEAAGGFTNDANSAVINLAQPLNDGLQIYVPTIDEEVPTFATINEPTTTNSTRSETINVSSSLVNINTATKAELETLPGIGPSTAQNILDHRDANGPFQAIEHIMDVSGIGDGRFEQIQDLITIGE